jgi:hypothetical protein
MRTFSFSIFVLTFLFIARNIPAEDKIEPNKHYPAPKSMTCKSSYENENIIIQVKDIAAILTVGPDTQYERQVVFQNVVGVRDAMGIYVYTSTGFALLVNHTTGKGTYMGAVGLGAWSVQELQQLSVDCEKEPT